MSNNLNTISEQVKQYIVEMQKNTCANNPYRPALNLHNYNCYQWKFNKGFFDDAGYVIDYIDEYSLSKNNSIENLQALCPNCNAVKVKKFNKQKKHFTTSQLANGLKYMEVENI